MTPIAPRAGASGEPVATLDQIDRDSDRAVFRQITDHLCQAVDAGLYRPSGTLPSDATLVAYIGAAHRTAHQEQRRRCWPGRPSQQQERTART